MPLHPGKSKKVVSENIKEMQEAGHPHDQAVAAALHNAHPKGGYSDGGVVENAKKDKQEASQADQIDPVVTSSSTLKGYMKGGIVPAVSLSQEKAAFKPGGFPVDPNSVQHMAEGGSVLDDLMPAPKGDPMTEDEAKPGIGEISVGIQGIPKDPHIMQAVSQFIQNLYESPIMQKGRPELGSTLGTDTTGLQGIANREAGVNLPPAANAPVTQDMGYSGGGAVGFPHREKSGPGINTTPEHKYADGGEVGDDFSVGNSDNTVATPDLKTHNPIDLNSVPPPSAPLQFNPLASHPASYAQPAAPTAPIAQPAPSPLTAPGGNAITNYLNQQKADIGKYGPEQQLAVQNQLMQQRQSLGGRLPVALGGLADSIMQGVARAGNPGFAERIQGQQNKLAEEKLGTMEKAGTQNLAQTEAKMKLDAIDSSSALSKAKQQAYTPLLTKLGYGKAAISKMSSSDIENATTLMAQFGGKEIEAVIKRFELGLKAQEIKETAKYHEGELANKENEVQAGAAKTVLEGSKIPGVPPTHAAKVAAEQKLENVAGINKPGPYGQTTVRNGKTYEWHPETGKYYLAAQ